MIQFIFLFAFYDAVSVSSFPSIYAINIRINFLLIDDDSHHLLLHLSIKLSILKPNFHVFWIFLDQSEYFLQNLLQNIIPSEFLGISTVSSNCNRIYDCIKFLLKLNHFLLFDVLLKYLDVFLNEFFSIIWRRFT